MAAGIVSCSKRSSGTPGIAGIDIGGANLKAVHSDGTTVCSPFAVYRDPVGLASATTHVLTALPPFVRLGVTMTAELCDCYRTKREGVLAILDAVCASMLPVDSQFDVLIYCVDGCFRPPADVRMTPLLAAASNWLALAEVAAKVAGSPANAMLCDMGSTTVDIVAIVDGTPRPQGRTDTDRLLSGELIYSGLRRTPVHAIAREVPYRGSPCPVIPELFATMQDAHLLTGTIAEDSADTDTADGKPLESRYAHQRLARIVGADCESFTRDDALSVAEFLVERQAETIRAGLRRRQTALGVQPHAVVVSGEGETFVAGIVKRLWGCRLLRVSELAGTAASRAACAYSLVELLSGVSGAATCAIDSASRRTAASSTTPSR